nr:hypothetical protein [Tanacetum cinerariifolium]
NNVKMLIPHTERVNGFTRARGAGFLWRRVVGMMESGGSGGERLGNKDRGVAGCGGKWGTATVGFETWGRQGTVLEIYIIGPCGLLRTNTYNLFLYFLCMRTCSSFNLPVESPPNPSTSNPKRRNRRRSKQPFILEESTIDTMADQRTMAELLRAPTEGYAEAIVVPFDSC